MKKIKLAICGAGCRGSVVTEFVFIKMEEVEIVGVCDPYIDKAEELCKLVEEARGVAPKVYADYIQMFEELKPDAVFDATSWEEHIHVAIAAMERNIAVALEVGGAYTAQECYDLVDAYERTKTPIMFMENCCFGKHELLGLSLARRGELGEIVYCHGAYAHDLREEVAYGNKNRHYRLRNYIGRNCDNYPTHNLGPIAKVLDINRGNRMVSLISMASPSKGISEYIRGKEDLQDLQAVSFQQGDVVQTLIKCENGEMISLKLDTGLPKYYSREFTLRGTKGGFYQETEMVLKDGEGEEDFNPYDTIKKYGGNMEKYASYLPKIWREVTPETLETGHGGMDYFVFRTFIDALINGEEMPIDVYDAASWMVISALTEESIKNGGSPVLIPDFTKGEYKNRKRKDVVNLDE